MIKIIIVNNGEDLFVIGNDNKNYEQTYIYYIINFRTNKNIKKYYISKINIFDFQIIYNKDNICIKTKKKII